MATTAAELMVKVGADIADAQRKMNQMSGAIQDVGRSAMRMGSMMTLGITTPLVTAGLAVTKFASDLSESSNKANVVFGEQAAAIQKWAETASTAFGMSRQQALEAAGTFGNLFTSMGLAADQSAEMSQGLVKLASDLASFNNIDPTVALEKLRAGLVGEVEPLRALGISLSAAAVEAQAFEMGLAATAAELTEADKAAARYALILEQSSNAQGDFARTSEGLANKTRIVKAQFADAAATLGATLLPYVQKLVDFVSQVIAGFANLDPRIQTFIVGAAAVAAALGPAITILGAVATALGALISPIGLVVAAIVGLGAIVVNHFGGIQETVNAAVSFVQAALASLTAFMQSEGAAGTQALAQAWTTAKEVIGAVVAAISSVVQAVMSTVAGFLAAHGAEIQAFVGDAWTQIGAIVNTAMELINATVVPILTGIGQFIADHSAEIQTLLGGAWEIISTTISTVLGVIQGLLTAALALIKGDWQGAWVAIQELTTTLWNGIKSVITTALNTILQLAGTSLADIKKAFVDKWNEIKAFLQSINLADIGRAIMQGMIDGIKSMAGALVAAAQGVVQGAIDAAKNLLGIHSPSLVFLNLGYQMLQGLIKGIEKGTPEAISAMADAMMAIMDALDALAKWDVPSGEWAEKVRALMAAVRTIVREFIVVAALFTGDALAKAKAFAESAGAVMQLIGNAIGSLMKFKDYDKDFSLVDAGAQKLVDQIGAFVRKLARLAATFDADLLAQAKKFADAAGPVVTLIGNAIGSLMKFKDYDKDFSLVDAGAQKLVDQIGAFVRKLARLAATFDANLLAEAKKFADAAGPVVTLIGNAIGSLMKFKDYDKDFNLANAGAQKLVDQIGAFVRKLARLGQQIGQPAMAAAVQFAEAAGKVLATISDALDLLTKIKTYVSPTANALLAFERDVEDMLLRFTRWVVFVIQPLASDIDSEAMQAMQEMVAGLQGALEVLNGLVDYVSPGAAAIAAFMDGVEQLAMSFIRWAQTGGPQLFAEIPPEFLAAFRDVFDGLQAAVDVLTALVDFVPPAIMAVLLFEEGYQRLFQDWVNWATGTFKDLNIELVQAIADVFNAVMGGLRTAVDVLTALATFVPPAILGVLLFEEGYQRLFQDWVAWATGTFEDLNVELVAAIAGVFGDVFTGIGAAVETLSALSDYVSPSAAAITAFEADYQRLFTGFVNWVETTFTGISSDLVVVMAGAASSLFQGLGAAVTTLTQITGYVGPTEATIVRFEQDYQRIANGFRLWAVNSWTEETAAATTAVGNAVNALYQGLGTAATTLSLIRNYTPPSQAVIDRFIADMTNVMGTMLAWVETSFDVDAQEIMTSFGTTTQTLFSGIGTALNVLEGIADYTVTDSEFRLALQRFNANLLLAITSWQTWLTNTFTPETAALVQQFHTIMSGIVADMGAALNLLMDIEQANLPTADELLAFLQAVADLFDGTVNIFATVISTIENLVQNMAFTMAYMFNLVEEGIVDFQANVMNDLQILFDGLADAMYAAGAYAGWRFLDGLLIGMGNVTRQNAVIAAMRDLADALEAELRAAWGIGSPSKVAERIGGFFVTGLERGLEDLSNIPALIQRNLAMGGVSLGAEVRFSPAPRHDYLTIEFQGAYQAGMGPAEEKRITQAMVGELRRQGVVLQVARV